MQPRFFLMQSVPEGILRNYNKKIPDGTQKELRMWNAA